MSEAEVRKLLKFSFDDDVIDEIFNNTEYERQQIQNYTLAKTQRIPTVRLKDYPKIHKQISNAATLNKLFDSDNIQERCWINECWKSLTDKSLDDKQEYVNRLEIEADVIDYIGHRLNTCLFAYFNTFRHYINLFWQCGSITGPGRGSATGFLSNYLLGITQLDPLRWNLPWFRFLNKERAELPD